MFKKEVLRGKKKEVTGGRRKLVEEEHPDLYPFHVIKCDRRGT
jgi:hypothetical protein